MCVRFPWREIPKGVCLKYRCRAEPDAAAIRLNTPLITFSSVVFPEPLGPIRPVIVVGADVKRYAIERDDPAEPFYDRIDGKQRRGHHTLLHYGSGNTRLRFLICVGHTTSFLSMQVLQQNLAKHGRAVG